jgi:hypothetical protein
VVTGSVKRVDADVVGEVDGGGVDPQGPAQPQPGSVQQLPEAGDQVQPRLEPLADRLDPDVTVAVEQAGAVQDGEPADFVGPAIVVPQQHEQVGCGQPFQDTWLGHHLTLLPLAVRDPHSSGNPEA